MGTLSNKGRVANMVYTTADEYGIQVQGGDSSHTDLKSVTIHSDEVLINALGMTAEQALLVQTAAAAHEGGHKRFSDMEPMVAYMETLQKNGLDMQFGNDLIQIVEDYRVDSKIAEEFPGYRDIDRESMAPMESQFGQLEKGDPNISNTKAISWLLHGTSLKKYPAWKNLNWPVIEEVTQLIHEKAGTLPTSADAAKMALELYAKYGPELGAKAGTTASMPNQQTGTTQAEGEDAPTEGGMEVDVPGEAGADAGQDGDGAGEGNQGADGAEQEGANSGQQGGLNTKREDSDDKGQGGGGVGGQGDQVNEHKPKVALEQAVKEAMGKTMLDDVLQNGKDANKVKNQAHSAKEKAQNIALFEQEIEKALDEEFGTSILTPEEVKRLREYVGAEGSFNQGTMVRVTDPNNLKESSKRMHDRGISDRAGRLGMLDQKARVLGNHIRTLLASRATETVHQTNMGKLKAATVWKATNCNNNHVFTQTEYTGEGGYKVDIVVDASGSNASREGDVANVLYVMTKGLRNAGIPVRVHTFCTLSAGSTAMIRMVDYDSKERDVINTLGYVAGGANRDGVAYRAAYHMMEREPDTNHLMFCISDGQPSGSSSLVSKHGGSGQYENLWDLDGEHPTKRKIDTLYMSPAGRAVIAKFGAKDGVDDTAEAVREIRKSGVALMGVFVAENPDREAIFCEKMCFGNDFATITSTSGMVEKLEKFMRDQILKTFE